MKRKPKIKPFVYYESMKRKGCGTGTPKDKDEVNKREVFECEG
jgi:hypothetical protein